MNKSYSANEQMIMIPFAEKVLKLHATSFQVTFRTN